jgi:hypothetical protein
MTLDKSIIIVILYKSAAILFLYFFFSFISGYTKGTDFAADNLQKLYDSGASFTKVLPREVYSFLTGNNNDSETSGFQKLTHVS